MLFRESSLGLAILERVVDMQLMTSRREHPAALILRLQQDHRGHDRTEMHLAASLSP